MSRTADNYSLKKIAIAGKDIDIGNIEVINIYEGLTNPALTGTAAIKDREALLEFKEVFAGDTIELMFDTETESNNPFTFKGIITSADGGQIDIEHTFPLTVLHFCSAWWFKAITKQVSKAYKNVTYEEILEDLIVNECGGSFEGIYPPIDKKIERIVFPNWTVAHSIKYLINGMHGKPEQTGYTIYDNLNQQSIIGMSINYLFEGNWGKHSSDLIFGTQNILYDGNVEKIFLESYFDSLRYLNQGVFQTDSISFDYDHTKFYTSSKSVDKLDLFHLAPTMPLLKDHATEEFRSISTNVGPIHQQKIRTEKEFKNYVDGQRNDRYCNLFSDMLKFNLVLPGNTNRTAGMIVKFDFPSIKSQVDKKIRHKFLEGHYLIRNINHVFKNDAYNQAMTLCRDGFGAFDRTDLVQWKKIAQFEDNK